MLETSNGDQIGELSSDDSSNSEAEDWRLITRDPVEQQTPRHFRQRRRRAWNPGVEREAHTTNNSGEHIVLEEILRREHFVEQYIGDRGDADQFDSTRCVRMATANINKGIIAKLDSEISTWFLANKLDFMAISDTGLQQASTRTVWVKGTSGARTPGLILISNRRAGILSDSERWQSRIKKHETQFSPSGRSISISLRLGKRAELKIIATYMPDTPQVNTDETSTERRWIAQFTAKARQQRQIVIVAGDFNTYPDEERDRQGPGIRSSGARRESDKFCAWTEDNGLASTFKYRHPTAERFTYTNGGRSSALDDIYVSRQHAHQIAHSGIWLHSLNHGDHVGTPFVSLRLSQMQQTRRHLVGVTNIKYIDTKKKTPDEMKKYTTVLSELLETGELSLIKPIEVRTATAGATEQWLHDAITNIYKCMYSAGKNIWGEKSQARKEIDRAVSKKRTARCHGQFKAVMRLAARSNTIASDISRAVQKLQWPKWIVDPERLPQLCPHKTAAMELEVWRRQEPPSELHMMKTWLECGWRLWKKVTRIRSGWRQRRKVEIGRQQRSFWFETNGTRRFLRDVLGPPLPPVSIRGALVGDGPEYEYTESREAVRNTLVELLDNWVPSEQKTTELDHLSSWSEQDEETLPQFVKEWLLEDIKAGGTRAEAFEEHGDGNRSPTTNACNSKLIAWSIKVWHLDLEGLHKKCGLQHRKKFENGSD